MEMVITNELVEFSPIFATEVFPFYKQHEETFDVDGIHGVLHIARAIIAGYVLAKKSNEFGMPCNINDVIIANAFHDSGRKNGGIDYWESFSAQNCDAFVRKSNFYRDKLTDTKPEDIASLILKKDWIQKGYASHPRIVDFMCVHDSDVLEIMRPCCGRGGRNSFNQERLLLYTNNYKFYEFYGKFINEWNSFILATEAMKKEISTPNCIGKLIIYIEVNKKSFPTIHSIINN